MISYRQNLMIYVRINKPFAKTYSKYSSAGAAGLKLLLERLRLPSNMDAAVDVNCDVRVSVTLPVTELLTSPAI